MKTAFMEQVTAYPEKDSYCIKITSVLRFIYFILPVYFACMYVRPELDLWIVVSYHVGAEN